MVKIIPASKVEKMRRGINPELFGMDNDGVIEYNMAIDDILAEAIDVTDIDLAKIIIEKCLVGKNCALETAKAIMTLLNGGK